MLIAVDRDREALTAAEMRLSGYSCEKRFIHANYSDTDVISAAASGKAVDGILLDLGVSSYQLDNEERGFSYMHDAPMDMRMNEDDSFTAYDVVNGYSEAELSRIIKEYGEERWAVRIAQFIVKERKTEPIKSTGQLTEIIKAAIPAKARRTGPHPAKRTFQAIRIEVNDELGHLRDAVAKLPDLLSSGGRIAIITFHSLEDRIVKQEFERRLDPCTCPKEFPVCVCGKVADVKRVTRKPIVPSDEELELNPRSRSAKLRVLEKL
jgi:16S rRNA (cytosine1402-N4)-methyltransferase